MTVEKQLYSRPESAPEAGVSIRAGVLEGVEVHHDNGVSGHESVGIDPRAEEVSAVEKAQQGYFGILSEDFSILIEPYTMRAG